jgi:regulator of protease activity HflC (stomatin/prohibitin superfamily)
MPLQSIDILYLCLSVSVMVMTILLAIVLVRLMSLLRDVNEVSRKMREITEKVDTFITTPILLSKRVFEFLHPFIEKAEDHFKSSRKKRS